MKYLVTGGAGFIGSNLVEELVRRKEEVVILDNELTGNFKNCAPWKERSEWIKGDIRDLAVVRRACKGVDYVVHLAALGSVPRSVQEPLLSAEINTQGTLNVLMAARDEQVKKVVFSSSSSVYGNTQVDSKQENHVPQPASPYAASKLAAEYFCRVFEQCYGLKTVVLRYFNVFGPRQDPHSQYAAVIPRFIAGALRQEPVIIYGDGSQTRDFTYVKNNVDATIRACTKEGVHGEVLNIACGASISLLQMLDSITRITGKEVKVQFASLRVGEVKHSHASIEKAKIILGYKPKYSFEEGLKETIQHYQQVSLGT